MVADGTKVWISKELGLQIAFKTYFVTLDKLIRFHECKLSELKDWGMITTLKILIIFEVI